MRLASFWFVFCIVHNDWLASIAAYPVNGMSPIVIVPGIGGSQINAKLDRNATKHIYCYKKYEDWYSMWLSVEELLPLAEECWVDNFKLQWNDQSGRMENVPGVFTNVPDFGNTTSIEYLDPSYHSPSVYFFPFVDALTKQYGYVRGKTIRAAPYDFRYDPSSAEVYLTNLQNLITQTYGENGNQQIVLVSHSMGAPYTLYLLNKLSQEWKDKYIKSWVTISGIIEIMGILLGIDIQPWPRTYAGAVKALKAYISGDGFGIPKLLDKPLTLREFQRTFSSLAYILPDARFWKSDKVIVKTSNRSYTVKDYNDLFQDMKYPMGSKVLDYVPKAWNDVPPGIKTYCVHGADVPTAEQLFYDHRFPDMDPFIKAGNGDGTVNFRSLEACRLWSNDVNTALEYKILDGATHNGILGDPRLIKYFEDVLIN